MFIYEPTGGPYRVTEKLSKCIGCLDLAPYSVLDEYDGLCEECASGEWPKQFLELPDPED